MDTEYTVPKLVPTVYFPYRHRERMATVGDQLFCYALLIAAFFRMIQCMLAIIIQRAALRAEGGKGLRTLFKMVLRGEEDMISVPVYMIEVLPLIFLFTAPVAVAVSATDSEYAGISVLLSIATLGQLSSQQRADAGYTTAIERAYRWALIVSAVMVMISGSGLSFLRTDVAGLHFSREQKKFAFLDNLSGHDWRSAVACAVALVPVNWSRRILWNVVGHFIKVAVALTLLLARRGQVLLTCQFPSYPCAFGRLTKWLWSPASERAVMALLFVSTMAGDLSWRSNGKL